MTMDSSSGGSLPISTTPLPSVFDAKGLAEIKRAARTDDPKALKAAAKQFEALFVQMVLKSMREATPKDGMFDSEQSRFYESLLDQQLAQSLSAKGGGTGLAALIEKQLSRHSSETPAPDGPVPLRPDAKFIPLTRPRAVPLSVGAGGSQAWPAIGGNDGNKVSTVAGDFVAQLMPLAVDSAAETGIPAHFMVAQAALETGWGRAMPRSADGRSSNNLFGIKAGRDWNGPVVETTTVEYVNGVTERQTQRFRAYGSYAESFDDYARLLSSNPRYAGVLARNSSADGMGARGFARGLQAAGYATDPAYASKLERLIVQIASA